MRRCILRNATSVTVITVAASASASTSSPATASIVVASITATFDAICMSILTKSIVGGLVAVVHRAGFTVAKSWTLCQSRVYLGKDHSHRRSSLCKEYDLPPSLPENPPRPRLRPARPPRSLPAAPPPASLDAVAGASRLPCRAIGLSATFGGGTGSLSESWSLSLPVTENQLKSKRRGA